MDSPKWEMEKRVAELEDSLKIRDAEIMELRKRGGTVKAFVIVTFIVIVGLGVLSVYLALDRNHARSSLVQKEEELGKRVEEVRTLGLECAAAEGAKLKAEKAMTGLAEERDQLKSQSITLTNKLTAVNEVLGERDEEVEQLRALVKEKDEDLRVKDLKNQEMADEVKNLTTQREKARAELEAAQAEVRKARETRDRLADENNDLQEQLSALKKTLEAKEAEIADLRRQSQDPVSLLSGMPSIEGEVHAVRRDDEGELIFLAGFSGGDVKDGMRFGVFREDELVGRVEVVRYLNGMAGARPIFRVRGEEIRKGDRVRTSY